MQVAACALPDGAPLPQPAPPSPRTANGLRRSCRLPAGRDAEQGRHGFRQQVHAIEAQLLEDICGWKNTPLRRHHGRDPRHGAVDDRQEVDFASVGTPTTSPVLHGRRPRQPHRRHPLQLRRPAFSTASITIADAARIQQPLVRHLRRMAGDLQHPLASQRQAEEINPVTRRGASPSNAPPAPTPPLTRHAILDAACAAQPSAVETLVALSTRPGQYGRLDKPHRHRLDALTKKKPSRTLSTSSPLRRARNAAVRKAVQRAHEATCFHRRSWLSARPHCKNTTITACPSRSPNSMSTEGLHGRPARQIVLARHPHRRHHRHIKSSPKQPANSCTRVQGALDNGFSGSTTGKVSRPVCGKRTG